MAAAATSSNVVPATTPNGLQYMSSVFEGEGELSVLDISTRKTGDYIDFIKGREMPFFLMKGQDKFGRHFFSIKCGGSVQTFFERYTSSTQTWSDGGAGLINFGGYLITNGRINATAMQQVQTLVAERVLRDTQYRISFTATVLSNIDGMPLDVQKIVFSYIGNVPNLPAVIQNANTAVTDYETNRAQELGTAVVVASHPLDA